VYLGTQVPHARGSRKLGTLGPKIGISTTEWNLPPWGLRTYDNQDLETRTIYETRYLGALGLGTLGLTITIYLRASYSPIERYSYGSMDRGPEGLITEYLGR